MGKYGVQSIILFVQLGKKKSWKFHLIIVCVCECGAFSVCEVSIYICTLHVCCVHLCIFGVNDELVSITILTAILFCFAILIQ